MGQRTNPVLNRSGINNFGNIKNYPSIKKLYGISNTSYIFILLHYYFLRLRFKLCYFKNYIVKDYIILYVCVYKLNLGRKKKKKAKLKIFKVAFKYFSLKLC
jgi:hypothetical protein